MYAGSSRKSGCSRRLSKPGPRYPRGLCSVVTIVRRRRPSQGCWRRQRTGSTSMCPRMAMPRNSNRRRCSRWRLERRSGRSVTRTRSFARCSRRSTGRQPGPSPLATSDGVHSGSPEGLRWCRLTSGCCMRRGRRQLRFAAPRTTPLATIGRATLSSKRSSSLRSAAATHDRNCSPASVHRRPPGVEPSGWRSLCSLWLLLRLDLELQDFTVVHRAVAVGHILDRPGAIEDAARLDPSFENVRQ